MSLEGAGTLQSHFSSPGLCLSGQKFVLSQAACQGFLWACLWRKREVSKQPQCKPWSCARRRERLLPLLAFNVIKLLWAKSSSGPHFINWQCRGLSNVPRSPGCLIHVHGFIYLAMWLPSSGSLWNFSVAFKALFSPTTCVQGHGCHSPLGIGDHPAPGTEAIPVSSFFRHSDLCPYYLLLGLLQ